MARNALVRVCPARCRPDGWRLLGQGGRGQAARPPRRSSPCACAHRQPQAGAGAHGRHAVPDAAAGSEPAAARPRSPRRPRLGGREVAVKPSAASRSPEAGRRLPRSGHGGGRWPIRCSRPGKSRSLRETFAYAGRNARSVHLADQQVEGRSRDRPTSIWWASIRISARRSNSVVVLREKVASGSVTRCAWETSWAGSRLVQIRPRDAVFMIQDFGFERQETLSLRKQEDETP